MRIKKVTVRAELLSDYEAIHHVETEAFGQPDEGKLVRVLRSHKDFKANLSLVAIDAENQCVGHVLFFPIRLSNGISSDYVLSLGPIAVLPKYQVSGIGKQLIWEGVRVAKEQGYAAMVVLGHESYYPKFGFINTLKWNIRNPFGAPDESYFAQELTKGFFDAYHGGTIEYPLPFYE